MSRKPRELRSNKHNQITAKKKNYRQSTINIHIDNDIITTFTCEVKIDLA